VLSAACADRYNCAGSKQRNKEHRVEYAHHPSALYHGIARSGRLCGDRQNECLGEERMLAAAGFQMKLADTPERMKRVSALPQRKFVKVPYRDGTVRYVWADAEFCKCIYAGTEAAHSRYWKLAMNTAIATDEAQAAMAADFYGDSGGAWGPWGPWW
jgi:hypothetical protein